MLIKQTQKKEMCHEMLDVNKLSLALITNTKAATDFAGLSAIHFCMFE